MVLIDRVAPIRFVETAYEGGDWVAVFVKSYDTGETAQRVVPVSAVTAPRFQAWLRFRNADRWNVYVSVNAITPGRSRTREAIAAVRHAFLDVDRDAPRLLRELALRRDLPTPSYVLHTSPTRVHVLWRVRDFEPTGVERLQKRLARDLGTDTAATSCAQMTRLPGFVNYKHESPHVVTVDYRAPGCLLAPRDFPQQEVVHAWNGPSLRTAPILSHVPPDALERARQYLVRTRPAVSGQHGDMRTFRICCRLVRGFALSDDDALSVLRDWNTRCDPPWSIDELLAKLSHARCYGREPVGGLLR